MKIPGGGPKLRSPNFLRPLKPFVSNKPQNEILRYVMCAYLGINLMIRGVVGSGLYSIRIRVIRQRDLVSIQEEIPVLPGSSRRHS